MKKYLLNFVRHAIIFFFVCILLDYFFFDVRTVKEYLVQVFLFALMITYYDWRKDKNRQKMNLTETEEEKAILDGLRNQVKPFMTNGNNQNTPNTSEDSESFPNR